jgi:hypothetical protein
MIPIRRCDHDAPKPWAPLVITRWSNKSKGYLQHHMPFAFCERCTQVLTLDDVFTDEMWNKAQEALVRNGVPQQKREFSILQWQRVEAARKRIAEGRTQPNDTIVETNDKFTFVEGHDR